MSARFTAAEIDFRLKEQGELVVFADGSTTYGTLRQAETAVDDGNGFAIAGARTTLSVREGSQPAALREDDLLTHFGIAYRVRDAGFGHPDGLRRITLVTTED